jgi:hypothetical protein
MSAFDGGNTVIAAHYAALRLAKTASIAASSSPAFAAIKNASSAPSTSLSVTCPPKLPSV